MSYIGNIPAESYASFERQVFTIVNSQTAYTLTHAVTNENDIRLVINSVVQEPGSGKAYTAANTTLTLSAALVNGTDEMYCVYLGRALQTVNPPNASVGSSQVAASIITGQTALSATPADTDELLISDAGTLKRVDFSHLKSANTPAFFAYLGSNQDVSDDTWTKVNINTEEYDSNSMFDVSTYRFTPTTAGKYFFYATICLRSGSDNQLRSCGMAFYKNGSALYGGTNDVGSEQSTSEQISIQSSFSMNGSSDYVELYGRIDVATSTPQFSANYQGANRNTYFGAYKIIGA